MFKEAEENAPTIIFIDEMNELVPNREGDVHEMSRSAVNEMLAQMDRTGEKGIFIIGATNYPNMIDPAILRAGRLDKKYYLSPPDKEARKAMFELYLKERPYDFGLDYNHLAELTDNYVSPVVISGYVPDVLKSISMISDDFKVVGAGSCGKGYKEWVRVSDGGPALKVKVKLG
jgi:transitional endoplasmic reticulum ATPase